jgi:hypothetical protein
MSQPLVGLRLLRFRSVGDDFERFYSLAFRSTAPQWHSGRLLPLLYRPER